jgi:hypothetical protein
MKTKLIAGLLAALLSGCSISATKPELHKRSELGYVDPARQEIYKAPTAEKRRRDALAANPEWSPEIVRAVAAGEVLTGMTRAQVKASIGDPIGYGSNPERGPTRWIYHGGMLIWFGENETVVKSEAKKPL